LFLSHFDVICDLLLNLRAGTWNLFVEKKAIKEPIRFAGSQQKTAEWLLPANRAAWLSNKIAAFALAYYFIKPLDSLDTAIDLLPDVIQDFRSGLDPSPSSSYSITT